jgi:hypothetical protein
MYSSSLPSFPNDFHGAIILSALALECQQDDGTSPHFDTVDPEYECPALRTLEIDGRNYFNTCTRGLAWEFVASELKELSISRFDSPPRHSFSPDDFISQLAFLKNLAFLRISDVRLHCSSVRYSQHIWLDNLTYLELSDLRNPQVIDEIFDHIPDGIEIKLCRCAIGAAMGTFGDNGELTLQEISTDQDLVPLLSAWRGYDLHVSNCPSFDARILGRMHKKRSREYVCAQNARYLGIVDCPNISVSALQRLVAARLDGPDTRRFEMICVSGRVPNLSPKDRQWFKKNIPDFYYPRILAE